MLAEEFPEVNLRIAENDDRFLTLPAFLNKDGELTVTFAFSLNKEERDEFLKTGLIYFKQHINPTVPFQPIVLSTQKADLIPEKYLKENEEP